MSRDDTQPLAQGPISYAEARQLASHEDPAVRSALAGRDDIRPEILYYLAEDASAQVRRAAAGNRALPAKADLLLATDEDHEVRVSLAEKIALLAPGLSANEQDRLRRMTYEILETLARDQVTRVRQILSEALKDVADAPPDVIRRLARDAELVVSGPVLEFSPVLTADDLLEIIESGPVKGALGAISRRAQVSEAVSDAVVASDDVDAIADLLANPSAQIREETLDQVVDRASEIDAWHMPLVNRPKLPGHCASKLARMVADNLLDILRAREDLPPEALEAVKTEVDKRLAESDGAEPRGLDSPKGAGDDADDPMAEVRRLHEAGDLDAGRIEAWLQAGKRLNVKAALAVRAGMPVSAVNKVFANHSSRGMVSLAWKADLTPQIAEDLQLRIGGLAPRDVLEPEDDGGWPLSESDMDWQITFFSDMAGDDPG